MALVSRSGFNLRTAQTLTATKNTANTPSRKKDVGNPVSSAGILKINAPVAARVSIITTSTGSSEAISHGQSDGQHVHQQDERPDDERNFRELENGDEHQHQRQRRENLASPQRRCGSPCRRCINTGKTE